MSPYLLHLVILVALFATIAVAWNILGGFAGQVSLGHSLFVGAGAYTSTVLWLRWGVSPWLGLLAALALGTALGTFVGYVVFRCGLSGIYFALVTLALAEMAVYCVNNLDALGGVNGLSIPPAPPAATVRALQFPDKGPFALVSLGLLGLALTVSVAIRRSRLGFVLAAIRENERAAAALGIDVVGGKVTAAAISAGLAAMAGTLYAQYVLFIDSESVLGIAFSIEAIVQAFMGGVGTVTGPLWGALVLVPVSEWLRARLGGSFTGAHLIVYGAILIAVIRLAPDGLVGLLTRWRKIPA